MSPEKLQGVLDAAQMLAGKSKRAEAFAKYREVLDADPSHPEALSWVEDYLRTKRDYAALRDVLLASVRAVSGTKESLETRKERLREIAGICEGNLRDADGAVAALKQLLALDRSDDSARQALTRILEKAQRWDDLANLLEAEANAAGDLDTKIALEKKLAGLHEQKRRDFVAAAEAWARERGCLAVRVRSNVVRERAHAFYRREGFREIKTQQVLEKELGSEASA